MRQLTKESEFTTGEDYAMVTLRFSVCIVSIIEIDNQKYVYSKSQGKLKLSEALNRKNLMFHKKETYKKLITQTFTCRRTEPGPTFAKHFLELYKNLEKRGYFQSPSEIRKLKNNG
jgi:hypothetical protein